MLGKGELLTVQLTLFSGNPGAIGLNSQKCKLGNEGCLKT